MIIQLLISAAGLLKRITGMIWKNLQKLQILIKICHYDCIAH